MKEFLKQYVPHIYEYTQHAFEEVRSSALKLFTSLTKEYGESFVYPYRNRLKTHQIDFLNR